MDSFLTKLKQEAQCPLCSNTLCEPKLLQCFHTLCKSCIKSHAHLREEDNIFQCPKCSSETLLHELNDVEDLPISPVHSRIVQVLEFAESEKYCSVSESHSAALWECLDCHRSLCDECLNYHTMFAEDHRVLSSSELEEGLKAMLARESPCKTHLKNNLELFCKDCGILVCWTCMKNDHRDHKTLTLQEFKAIKKTSLTKALKEIERVGCSEMEKNQQAKIAINMKNDGEKAKEEVKKTTKKLVQFLLNKEQQLLNEIQRSVKRADRILSLIRHNTAAQEYIKNIIDNGTAADLIDLDEDEGCTRFTYNPFKIDTAGTVFDPNKELNEQVLNGSLGNFRLTYMSNPGLSKIIRITSTVYPQKKATLSVMTKHSSGTLNHDDSDAVDITISPKEAVKDVKKLGETDGDVKFEFTPRGCGQLTAEVKLNGKPVSNSPMTINVQPQCLATSNMDEGLQSALNTGSKDFTGIAVNKANTRIAVADFKLHCVRVFSMKGELILMYGSEGNEEEQLLNPRGLAFLSDVDLVIVDNGNNRVCIANTTTGSLLRTFGCEGNGKGEFSGPFGVHVDENSNIIICDNGNCRVQVFNQNGEYQYELTLNFNPYSVVTHNNQFYVSDFNGAMVHVIERKDNTTTVAFTIEGDSNFDCELKKPCGLSVDRDDNLLVCDQQSCVIYKFTLDGLYVGKSDKVDKPLRHITALNDGQCIFTSLNNGGCFCIRLFQRSMVMKGFSFNPSQLPEFRFGSSSGGSIWSSS